VTSYVRNDQSRSKDECLVVSSSRAVPTDVNHVLYAFVEYPASELLSDKQEHGVKERGGGEEGEEEGGGGGGGGVKVRYLSDIGYRGRNVTLSSYQVNI
jgi:hypothetical protein